MVREDAAKDLAARDEILRLAPGDSGESIEDGSGGRQPGVTADVIAPPKTDPSQRWSAWTMTILERLPLSYGWLIGLLALLAAVGQALEYSLRDHHWENWRADLQGGLLFVGLLVYIMAQLRILRRTAVKELVSLRPAVLVDDALYDRHVARTLCANGRVEGLLLLASAGLWVLLFLAPPRDLPTAAQNTPGGSGMLVFILLNYVLLGWLTLTLVYTAVRYARGLGGLARCPLRVNVFDPASLLPFGRLSLVYSLAPVGLALIPLVLLGPPRQAGGFLVMLFSAASLLMLFLPIWGVHRQMVRARQAVLFQIEDRLMAVQQALLGKETRSPESYKALSDQVQPLVSLRNVILEASSWPFRGERGIAQAILATSSPVIYFVLNQIVLMLISPMLRR